MTYSIICCEARAGMELLVESDSVDSIVTDPPYGLSREPDMQEVLRHWLAGDDYEHGSVGFMGKSWDSFVPGPALWKEAYRVLKPGGHLLAFFGTRTYDMGVLALRMVGFEIRDQIAWAYGSGFPKSHDVSKSIDKDSGFWRGRAGAPIEGDSKRSFGQHYAQTEKEDPITQDAQRWAGWGTAIKPAYEPIVVARKPLSESTVARNVLRWGTGALNIGGCRVPAEKITGWGGAAAGGNTWNESNSGLCHAGEPRPVEGRWPANLTHDGSDEVLASFPNESHRFFYCAKASRADRDAGLEGAHALPSPGSEFRPNHTEKAAHGDDGNPYGRWSPQKNNHPTVKPTELMRWLCRLVTPPGGLVLDPFTGSGSTGRGAVLEGFGFAGFELDPEYVRIASARIEDALKIKS